LLVRRSAVQGLLHELRAEVERRQPAETASPFQSELAEVEAPVEEIQASTLVPAALIREQRDLEAWLLALRERIAGILRDKKHVRITPGPSTVEDRDA
jgi:hypothetical protein